jgi:ribonuclease P protein component
MIPKLNRLKEREVKRVLQKWKPFFSYGIVANLSKNKSWFPRFAMILWGKSVKSGVERNYFRRIFFDKVSPIVWKDNFSSDVVFVVKKTTKLSKKDPESIKNFKKDIDFIIKKLT